MKIGSLSLLLIIPVLSLFPQENINDKLNVFLDCGYCDLDYVREHVHLVNYVRDRKDADVHVFTGRQKTGSGGREVSIFFVGLNEFLGKNDTLKVITDAAVSDDERKKKFIQKFQLGLIQYITKSPIAEKINISYDAEDDSPAAIDDPWDYWVFRTGLHGFYFGEESVSDLNLSSSFSASKVTEDMKFWIWFRGNYSESNYDYEDEKSKYITRAQSAGISYVHSISENWSAGAWVRSRSSTYSNIDFNVQFAPGIEYNFFPYSESSTHQFRIEYKIWTKYNNYFEPTIYLKNEETVTQQSMSIFFALLEPWGDMDLEITASNYFHNFKFNSVHANGGVELNLVKGLSLDFDVGISAIHDQITLPLSAVGLEELLLRQRELETQFDFYISFGFSYSFGSIYNNIVNTRFGD